MIALALKLSAADAGDFYDDAERWTRNHFAESQLTKCDWIYRTVAQRPKTQVGENETADRVPERNIGSFAGWSGASDWHIQGPGIMHCCTGNCARALYYIWEDILSYKDGVLRINMLLNLASKWADVQSYIPYEGQVDIIVKKDSKRVLVHVPEWIDTNSLQLTVEVDGKPRTCTWSGRYVDIGSVRAKSTVVVKFPIAERTLKQTIGKVDYTLIVKGSTVVFIDPPGRNCPLYLRDHYRENQVRWRKTQRFITDEELYY